jgi:hypothetical protein
VLKDEGQLVVVTPNPLWFVGLYYRNSGRNISVNADHVALFGASELMEIGERAGYLVSKWYYSGKDDMLSEFRPDGRIMSRIINLVYRFSRVMNLAFAHNQIVVIFQKDE